MQILSNNVKYFISYDPIITFTIHLNSENKELVTLNSKLYEW